MRIVLNGEEREATGNVTVLSLLEEIRLRTGRVAVEVNGAVVPRGDFESTVLAENDRIEIVCFVGGG